MTLTPETAAAWIASLPTATAMNILADAYELVLLAADEDNGGDDANGDTIPSDYDCIANVPVPKDRFGNPVRDVDVFNILDTARAQLLEWADLDREDLPRTTAAWAQADRLVDMARESAA